MVGIAPHRRANRNQIVPHLTGLCCGRLCIQVPFMPAPSYQPHPATRHGPNGEGVWLGCR